MNALRAAGASRFHESARAQVAGTATYIDDIPEVRGTLHAAPVCSPVAHGILRKLDASAALALPGVAAASCYSVFSAQQVLLYRHSVTGLFSLWLISLHALITFSLL